MLIHWIWLAHRPGLTDWAKVELLQHFQDPEDIYFADSGAFFHMEGFSREMAEALADKDLRPARKILDDCSRCRLSILTYRDAAYPARLKNIADPPLVLYYKGQLPEFDAYPVIGVVGTRQASAYGLSTAKRMGYRIARCGGIVVSGMAKGIDAMAMSGALAAGAKTVGVLGCGADIVYPLSNRELFRDVEDYGCILSEFAPGTEPSKWSFPRRNRIISGLSNGVLVVEAPEKSGALITAHLAAEQGRDVFVIPGNIDQPGFVGSNRLLRDGAIAVSSGWDILSEYEGLYPDKIRMDTGPEGQTACPEEAAAAAEAGQKTAPASAQKSRIPEKKTDPKEKSGEKIIDKEAPTAYSDVNAILAGLSSNERKIVLALQDGERLVDDVIAETGLTTGKLLACLTMLELKGIIKRLSGKRIILILNKTV